MLQKVVYPYEYMDDWEKSNEKSLPEKEHFYKYLNIEVITGADYVHVKTLCKDFENIMICIFKVIHYYKLMYLRTFYKYVSLNKRT